MPSVSSVRAPSTCFVPNDTESSEATRRSHTFHPGIASSLEIACDNAGTNDEALGLLLALVVASASVLARFGASSVGGNADAADEDATACEDDKGARRAINSACRRFDILWSKSARIRQEVKWK